MLTTNLPFSEWTQVIPNTRLCKALIDRITDRAHIIETGTESYRFRRTLERRERKFAPSNDSARANYAPIANRLSRVWTPVGRSPRLLERKAGRHFSGHG
ncbi:MAG: ATP-binding protein [Acidobacteriaceae bacterium]|nr:ATP-binding protein [Acidobacteriaceae bacterium]